MGKNNYTTFDTLKRFQSFRYILIIEGMLVGVVAGFASILYRLLLEYADKLLRLILTYCGSHPWMIPVWLAALIVMALTVGALIRWEPLIKGSGIPQVEGEMHGLFDMNWLRVIAGKFLGGVLSIGAGLSLGREGPSIQIGAAAGKAISKLLKRVKIEEKFFITCGASAGLAAAFNAPLAGVMFALEEIHKNFSVAVLLSAMSSSVIADFISKNIFGLRPVFQFSVTSMLPLSQYWILIVLGVILGLLGAFYNLCLTKTQDLYKFLKIKVHLRPLVPFILAGILSFTMPQVLGGGHVLVEMLTEPGVLIHVLLIFFIAKFAFSMISFGSGATGGIFFPLLILGALIGAIFGNLATGLLSLDSSFILNFIILSMAGYFTAIVRAPVTGIILISEMTGSFTHLLSLAVVSVTAFIVADILKSKPIYEQLLSRMKNSGDAVAGPEDVKTLIELAVHHGAAVEGRQICSVEWPEDCLLVAIRRSDEEIIPRGNTVIHAGDVIVVLTREKNCFGVRSDLLEKCEV